MIAITLRHIVKNFFFEESLGKFDNAAMTLTKMLRIKPDSAELYLKNGIYNEISGDTITAKQNFNRALPRYIILLDTMSSKHPDRRNTLNMLAINLIMLGHEKVLHEFLKENCKTALDSVFLSANVLSKTKVELIESMRRKYNR